MKRVPTPARIAVLALFIGVVVPYLSYKLWQADTCMPEEAGMFYLPVLVPLFEGCPLAFIGELGLMTLGLPAFIAGLFLSFSSNRTINNSGSLLFYLIPLLYNFIVYVVVISVARWLTRRL